jgi:hypothetical protein
MRGRKKNPDRSDPAGQWGVVACHGSENARHPGCENTEGIVCRPGSSFAETRRLFQCPSNEIPSQWACTNQRDGTIAGDPGLLLTQGTHAEKTFDNPWFDDILRRMTRPRENGCDRAAPTGVGGMRRHSLHSAGSNLFPRMR